ncbi:MAG TPA: tRNA pseudouridine(38-40) synthase TruA [Candidatus Limnocylindria bacterium]|nr:tRNA pseudouridine(38-40) synthase TruA [Candidatus Limnocylindria bacterium]
MRTFKIVLGYDGTGFHGWQVQPGRRTVQGVLEEALAHVLGFDVRLKAAGRTDAGCHARGQVASFAADTPVPIAALRPALNRRLPRDVRVRSAEEAESGFDARRSAIARRYGYRLLDREDVLWGRMAWHPGRTPDAARLVQATRPLEGDHDCAAFQAAGSTPTRTHCRVHRATWRRWEGGVMLDVIANHFLYHMVRNLVGTALALAERTNPSEAMRAVLATRDRSRAGPTAPPQGLCLEEVFYSERVRT